MVSVCRLADVRVHAEVITRLPECLSLDYSPMEENKSLFYAGKNPLPTAHLLCTVIAYHMNDATT